MVGGGLLHASEAVSRASLLAAKKWIGSWMSAGRLLIDVAHQVPARPSWTWYVHNRQELT